MTYEAFAEGERSGWADEARAAAYVDLFAPVSDQLIPPLIAAVDAAPGRAVLDLCCGHGNVTAALLDTGATATGLDFSPAMLARAQPRPRGGPCRSRRRRSALRGRMLRRRHLQCGARPCA